MFKVRSYYRCGLLGLLLSMAGWTSSAVAQGVVSPATAPASRLFIDYFLPTPIVGGLNRECWGAEKVLPRDQKNGLEDATMKQYCYWDGQIIKAKDGKYHMFSSRWDQAKGHSGWGSSVAVHSVSDNLFGPYEDKGMTWPDNQAGKGHNVTALVLPKDEGYAIVVSETRKTPDVFTAKSLDGPWVYKGVIQGVQNSNISIMVRPDGDYEIVPRNGQVYISKAADGILGPFKSQGPSVFPKGQLYPNMEDPCVFYTGGMYHIVVNSWSTRVAYHLTSKDGITNWVNRGVAYDPRKEIVKYSDGTVNHWDKAERPGVYIENGEVKAMTLAVLDVEKDAEKGNDNHGSKVIVIPFDGAAMNRDLAAKVAAEDAAKAATQPK